MTQAALQLEPPAATPVDGEGVVHCVTGRDAVMGLSRQMMEFSARCGQAGGMHDLGYFLSKPGAMPRIPYLLLVSRTADLNLSSLDLDEVLGVLLIFEQRIFGFGTGVFATNDRSGRGALIAAPRDRARVAGLAIRALLDRGARLILMSFRAEEMAKQIPLVAMAAQGRGVARWARRERRIAGYLPLLATYDATLARIGQRTRSNLRYYRRRAEAQLGCVFLPEIEVPREEMLEFNSQCMFAAPAEVAGWRYDSLRELSRPVLMGVKDREGRWLSMLGGRRYQDRSEILWQMNREGFGACSLGTVMRSYCIEHEIAQGSRRLYIEGGTPHPIRFSFVEEELTDLVVVRRTLEAKVMQMVAGRVVAPDNELSHMLAAKGLEWMEC